MGGSPLLIAYFSYRPSMRLTISRSVFLSSASLLRERNDGRSRQIKSEKFSRRMDS